MGRPSIDMSGRKIGKLTVLHRDESVGGDGKHARWICRCECGNVVSISGQSLRHKKPQQSCGCLLVTMHKTHGQAGTRLHAVWNCMKQRCRNKNYRDYKYYGARGISVCKEWLDFGTFREWAFANGYNEMAQRGICTIDRIDNNGNYEPSNCRWITIQEQQQNRRRPANWRPKE